MSPFFCHDLMPMRALTGDGVNNWNTDGHRFASLSQMGTDWAVEKQQRGIVALQWRSGGQKDWGQKDFFDRDDLVKWRDSV
jgi:hypothetical protein